MLIEQRRDLFILEALMLHHMAPVTGTVSHGQKDRLIPLARNPKRFVSPGIPVDRVRGVLLQVRAGFLRQPVLRAWLIVLSHQ